MGLGSAVSAPFMSVPGVMGAGNMWWPSLTMGKRGQLGPEHERQNGPCQAHLSPSCTRRLPLIDYLSRGGRLEKTKVQATHLRCAGTLVGL